MFRVLILLFFLSFGPTYSCSDENHEEPKPEPSPELDTSLIQYRGRMEFGANKLSSFSSPGSSIKVKFSGCSLYGTFSADNFDGNGYSYLYVILDENEDPLSRQIIRIEKAEQEYAIVEGLAEGEHIIEMVKNNECWGVIHFIQLRVPDGKLLALPAKKPHLIEFYGDSNPSGWSAWNDKDRGGDADSEGYYSYPGFTARSLDAEWVNFSVGGFGVTDRMGSRDLTDYYDKIHIYSHSPESNSWDFEMNNLGKKPDVLVINLGANDYYNNASKEEIKTAWFQFVSELLRPVYPEAHIVLANSYGWALGEPADYLAEVVQEFHQNGDQNISFVKFPWLWGQDHAVISEHAGFARILSKHIAETMGWESEPVPYSSIPEERGVLGNMSFESSILGSRPDGWRPDNGKSAARWVQDGSEAKDGTAFVRCSQGYGVHQAVDAQSGEQFKIKVWAKASSGNQGILKYQFRNQEQKNIYSTIKAITLTDQWQEFEIITEIAPAASWQIDVILRAEHNAVVDYDQIEMTRLK
jgi:hypothetical protein